MSDIEIGKTKAGKVISLALRFANRHGLVTGATGTGKTVTLQRLAEGFSRAGVPVFAADVKGDLSGMAASGDPDGKAAKRAGELGQAFEPAAFPVRFWDVLRVHGLPVMTSVDRIGALLLGRMLALNKVQDGTLSIAYRLTADEKGALLDLEDVRWQLVDMMEHRAEICERYGNITAASIATIQRELLAMEAQGAHNLFGEPGLDIRDFMQVGADGRGVINLLHADGLMEAPRLYACTLLWLLTELLRVLPEAGDLAKPKMVFFFDEAHLLFHEAPPKLLETIERVVRLVRSKGVGVFFVTQSPADVPDSVLAQLGNRIQHALRAYTPKDQRMIKAAAKAFRPNKGVDVQSVITTLAVGEALVSPMIEDGVPAPVERIDVFPPSAQIGPVSDIERETILGNDPLRLKYQTTLDHASMGRAFIKRVRLERGWPAVEESPDGFQDGDWAKYVPDFSEMPGDAPRSRIRPWMVICSFSALFGLAIFLQGAMK